MGKLTNGGPAFPGDVDFIHKPNQGMTLRDYFAAQALPALITSHVSGKYLNELSAPDLVGFAFVLADAMLAARAA